ncbi:MAG: hypothetical protein GWP08_13895 [Nitrospiraceae bacterium]|nr:hypothetical protein [Nitrospiraceae bacterium]
MAEPRNQCRAYCEKQLKKYPAETPQELPRAQFDRLAKAKAFADGPFKDTFGDGYGDSYNPKRQAFGRLATGAVVYCEIHKAVEA